MHLLFGTNSLCLFAQPLLFLASVLHLKLTFSVLRINNYFPASVVSQNPKGAFDHLCLCTSAPHRNAIYCHGYSVRVALNHAALADQWGRTRSWLNEFTSTDSVERLHCRPLPKHYPKGRQCPPPIKQGHIQHQV
jgi:hypothetical protein